MATSPVNPFSLSQTEPNESFAQAEEIISVSPTLVSSVIWTQRYSAETIIASSLGHFICFSVANNIKFPFTASIVDTSGKRLPYKKSYDVYLENVVELLNAEEIKPNTALWLDLSGYDDPTTPTIFRFHRCDFLLNAHVLLDFVFGKSV